MSPAQQVVFLRVSTSNLYGASSMNKNSALSIKDYALQSVENLSKVLIAAKNGGCTGVEYEILHKNIGMLIGNIQMKILEHVYEQYPELDDL